MESNSEKASYSLGYKMGFDLSHQFNEIDLSLLLKGIEDAIKGLSPDLPQTEMAHILGHLIAHTQQQASSHMAAKIKDQDEFFRKNGTEPGVRYLKDGIQYKVFKSAKGKSPSYHDSVSIYYRASLLNGTVLADNFGRSTAEEMRISAIMPGLAKALTHMKVGEKWKIFIPSEQAYGKNGRPPLIAPNSALIYEVELVQISEPKPILQLADAQE